MLEKNKMTMLKNVRLSSKVGGYFGSPRRGKADAN
jgi:hypothetical protein